jgi:hypothetical protein
MDRVLRADAGLIVHGIYLGNSRRPGLDPVTVAFDDRSREMIRAFEPASCRAGQGDRRCANLLAPRGRRGLRPRSRVEIGADLT